MKKEKEMSFIDHLEELRWHIIRSLGAILIFSIIAFLSKQIVFGIILLGPSKADFWTYRFLCDIGQKINVFTFCITELPFIIQSRQMAGQFMMHLSSSFVIGLICTFPYAFWEFWRFISPGLYANEKKAARGATFYVSLLFFIGILFGYFILTPISINFLANYQIDPSILNEFDIISYISTIIMLVLASGLLFQLPMVIYFLTKAGVVNKQMLKQYRRHAIVIILIFGATLTPPDPFSQIVMAVPLVGLYEISIFISGKVKPKYKKLLIKYFHTNKISFEDCGTHNNDPTDYPDYAHVVSKKVNQFKNNIGVLVCGSANGAAMAANKHKNIRAAICWSEEIASLSRTHNNANVICIPARFIRRTKKNN